MTIHLIKLCVGAESIEDLAQWQKARLGEQGNRGEEPRLWHITRMAPKRQDEVLDGGSLYWVIKGVVQVRQRISGFGEATKPDGTACCRVFLDTELVPVAPTPRRAFQGWRYLEPGEAPRDLDRKRARGLGRLPPEMRRQLAELGLL
jgi:hypothetical protein